MTIRTKVLSTAVAFLLLLAAASLAWACTGTSNITLMPEITDAGRQVALTGGNFSAPAAVGAQATQPAPIQIRWNSVTGAVLATAVPDASGNIKANVTIPAAAPGVYYVVAVGGASTARAVVQVGSGATGTQSHSSAAAASGLWQGFASQRATIASQVETPSAPAGRPAGIALLAFSLTTAAGAAAVAGLARRSRARS